MKTPLNPALILIKKTAASPTRMAPTTTTVSSMEAFAEKAMEKFANMGDKFGSLFG